MTYDAETMMRGRGAVGWIAALCGCGSPEAGGSPSAVTTASAAATSVSASAAPSATGPAPFDLAGFCAASCKRAVECGQAVGESLAGPADSAALKQAKAGQADTEKACAARCGKAPPTEAERPRAEAAKRCLEAADCAAYDACLQAIVLGSAAARVDASASAPPSTPSARPLAPPQPLQQK